MIIRLARTQTSAVSEHAQKTGHYPLWKEVKTLTGGVKEAIRIRLHPDNINRDSGIEIPEAWMPTIKKHNRRTVQQRSTEGATCRLNSEDRNAPITTHHRDIHWRPLASGFSWETANYSLRLGVCSFRLPGFRSLARRSTCFMPPCCFRQVEVLPLYLRIIQKCN